MEATLIDRIFGPFFSTRFTGRGMSLAAAYHSIKNHDGHIQAQSIPSEGSRFSI